ncbi:endonuclease III domain-containing protein [Halobacillus shinanisalinarum]|uniref:Endonuclease III domain-containing protein n=1 Tax=Halobacillus shinanisalinarum TaxID=2932258 RepID=A0ABY4GWL4_9BACI|nr:endonuclease III domain-containing protein [Halobacillus shinanisalinarum]UOQ92120.1 endonuclease III domain-containing protein [Halobacillus shinanisalinarum]
MKNEYQFIYNRLFEHYGPQGWWPAETRFEMMIGSILVQNTSWRNVEKALLKVKTYLEPEAIENLPLDELAQLIRSSGFFNIKAKRIKAYLEWFKIYDYDVDKIKKLERGSLRKELLAISGIGRETADVMLLYAFEKPIFVVDAYARRIFYRFGLDMPKSYDAFRQQVEAELPKELRLFDEFHALLVEHAKEHCRSTPMCNQCPLVDRCAKRLD